MKNAVLIVLAFALGGGAMWFFTSDDASTGAPAANAGGRPPGAAVSVPVAAVRPHNCRS